MIVLPDAEDRTIVCSFVLTKQQNVTDGQTDRQAVAITAVCITICEQCGRVVKTLTRASYTSIGACCW